MSNEIKITIEDWIKLPETQALEQIEPNLSFDDFEIIHSIKARETYQHVDTDTFKSQGINNRYNVTYAIGSLTRNEDEELLKIMSRTLCALSITAIMTKIEGYEIGKGKLIIQSRMPITIEDDNDPDTKAQRVLVWRGAIFRMSDTYELQ